MKSCLALLLFALSAVSVVAGERVAYVSAGGKLHVYSVADSTGKLTPLQQLESGGLIAISPDKSKLYTHGMNIFSHEILPDGQLELLGEMKSDRGGSYLDIDATGKFLAAPNYGEGSVRVWEINDEGVCAGAPVVDMILEKKAHSSVFSPNNRFLLVPATEPNKVFQLKFDQETGSTIPNDPPSAIGPTKEGDAKQPRNIRFHPNGRVAYTTLEREQPGVGVWKWDAASGDLKVIQNIVTLPENFSGSITTADLHLTPNAKFLYVSNRDLTDRKAKTGQSSIVGFKVDSETGKLSLIGHTDCEHIPRSFAIDEAGEFLYVAGQMAEKIGAYKIDQQTGELSRVQQFDLPGKPNWVKCLTLD